MYLVQPKETKWRLAYRYGITVQELEQYNPEIVSGGLKIGQEIIVPKRSEAETLALEKEFNYYKVKPKEGWSVGQMDGHMNNPCKHMNLCDGCILQV